MTIKKECKFAIHVPSYNIHDRPDYHLVKERIHFEDGTTKPNLKWVKNYKRPFYITKPNKRNHKQKKESESLDNLLVREVTQSELRSAVAKALDKHWSKDSLKQLATSPYLYGTDISSTSLLMYDYRKKYGEILSAYSVCTFDIETDVIKGNELIIMATATFEDKCYTVILDDFVSGIANVKDQLRIKANQYIKPYLDKHNMLPEFDIAKDHIELLTLIFNKIHSWQPDILAIWNMNFDIVQVLKAIDHYKVDPKSILCDPSVPEELRICKYKQGPSKKVTASGQLKLINPAAQWHTLTLTASFYVIDAMCVYKQIRLAQQEEPSYSLDAILNKELGIRKLSFKEADGYQKLKWHQFMQTNYKLEYIIYNIFDSLSMLELDMKTKDLRLTLPTYAYITDFANFNSQPRKIADALHYFYLDRNEVLGTVGSTKFVEEVVEEDYFNEDDEEEEDDDILSLKGWISTLPSHMVMPGLQVIEEDHLLCTNIRTHVFDSDAVSAYPTCTSIANVSKATTKREIIKVGNIDEPVFRAQNINCLFGHVNALEYSHVMFNFPNPWEISI